MTQKRVICYVDGFNLYHAIDNLNKPHLKWLDLRSLVEKNYVNSHAEKLVAIKYFSALATHRPSVGRHRTYIRAIQSTGVEVILGKFGTDPKLCRRCNYNWDERREKKSDVRLACTMVVDAYTDQMDTAILISNDTDFVPPIEVLCGLPNPKTVRALVPPGMNINMDLSNAADTNNPSAQITRDILEQNLFNRILRDEFKKIIRRPPEYDPPK